MLHFGYALRCPQHSELPGTTDAHAKGESRCTRRDVARVHRERAGCASRASAPCRRDPFIAAGRRCGADRQEGHGEGGRSPRSRRQGSRQGGKCCEWNRSGPVARCKRLPAVRPRSAEAHADLLRGWLQLPEGASVRCGLHIPWIYDIARDEIRCDCGAVVITRIESALNGRWAWCFRSTGGR